MEKKKTRLFLAAATPIVVLFIVSFTYLDLRKKNPYNQWIQSQRRMIVSDEVEERVLWKSHFSRLVQGEPRSDLQSNGFVCHSSSFSRLCLTSEPVMVDTRTNNITVYVPNSNQTMEQSTQIIVKPYGRQENNFLEHIKPVKILQGNSVPACQFNYSVPSVIFSSAYVGNTFHEFSDLIIPLFLTTHLLKSRVQIVLDDYNSSFVEKFSRVLSSLSDFQVMDPSANPGIHCFPGSIIGLAYHDVLSINPGEIPGEYTMPDFREFLRKTFNLKNTNVKPQIKNPKLLLLSRAKTRRFLNEDEIVFMIQELGFRVILGRDELAANMTEFSRIVNSCSVLVGAHGAGLANEMFLPAGGVTVQLELLGLESAASYCFGNPAGAMDLHYVPYRIERAESSLLEIYGADHPVIVNPGSVYAKGYQAVQEVYLDQQDLRVNVARFRETLVRALGLVRNYDQASEVNAVHQMSTMR